MTSIVAVMSPYLFRSNSYYITKLILIISYTLYNHLIYLYIHILHNPSTKSISYSYLSQGIQHRSLPPFWNIYHNHCFSPPSPSPSLFWIACISSYSCPICWSAFQLVHTQSQHDHPKQKQKRRRRRSILTTHLIQFTLIQLLPNPRISLQFLRI